MPFSGKKLKQCRDRRNWSLSDLAQTSGVNKGYLSNLENGVQANPGLDIVEKLATVFKVPLDHFSDSKRSTAGSLTELPDGLRQFMDRRSRQDRPLDRKSLEYLRRLSERGPSNWSAQEWESLYRSYLELRPGAGRK
ncbi:MAG: helix-turn-helix transcriptional regulator [bacterium]|nr:helix-turn-helix transcriptional regulator [bacterium]